MKATSLFFLVKYFYDVKFAFYFFLIFKYGHNVEKINWNSLILFFY